MLDDTDRLIINTFQSGFPLSERPYAEAAAQINLTESELIDRIGALLETGMLTRFGPLFNADRMGGSFCLCAMSVPQEHYDRIAAQINARIEVAHNYARDHILNMWFVLAVERGSDVENLCSEIERETGCQVLSFPKQQEFFVDFRVQA